MMLLSCVDVEQNAPDDVAELLLTVMIGALRPEILLDLRVG